MEPFSGNGCHSGERGHSAWSRSRNRIELFRLMRYERIAEDLEQPRLALPTSLPEGINRRAYIDIYETTLFQHPPPACARQATGNSVGPEVDVADSPFRHGLAGCDVGKLQSPTGPQHPHNLIEDAALVGAEIDDAVADDNIGPTTLDRQVLDDPSAELNIAEAHRGRRRAGAFQHLLGHIDADDLPLWSDLFGGDKAVEPATRPEIDDPLAGVQRPLREGVAHPGKRFDRALRHPGHNGLVVTQAPRQRASDQANAEWS